MDLPNSAPVEAQWATSTTDGIARKVAAWQRLFSGAMQRLAWCKEVIFIAVSFWWLAPTVFDKLEVGSLLVPGRITSIEALGIIWNSAWETIKYWRFDDSRHVLIGILAESRCVFFKCFLVLALWFLLSQIDDLSWVVESLDFNSCGTWSSCFFILCKVKSSKFNQTAFGNSFTNYIVCSLIPFRVLHNFSINKIGRLFLALCSGHRDT